MLTTFLDFAVEIATEAGEATLAHFGRSRAAEWKGDGSPVTVADRASERILRERIERAWPDHALLGEEFGGGGNEGATHRWVLDPIDGTVSFVHGVPLYGVLVGLEIEGEAVVGVAHFPALGETYSAARGHGCRRNGSRVSVSKVESLSEATLGYTDLAGFDLHGCPETFERVRQATRTQRAWGDAYGHCLVAAGRIDLMLEPFLHPWDRAALLPILREAGGFHGGWDGLPHPEGGTALSTSAALRDAALDLVRTA